MSSQDDPHGKAVRGKARSSVILYVALLVLCATTTGAWIIFLIWGAGHLADLW